VWLKEKFIMTVQRFEREGKTFGPTSAGIFLFHKDNLRLLPQFPDFFVIFRILSSFPFSLSHTWKGSFLRDREENWISYLQLVR